MRHADADYWAGLEAEIMALRADLRRLRLSAVQGFLLSFCGFVAGVFLCSLW